MPGTADIMWKVSLIPTSDRSCIEICMPPPSKDKEIKGIVAHWPSEWHWPSQTLLVQFDLSVDKSQLWRCGSRIANSDTPSSAYTPILLVKSHHLTALLVIDTHRHMMHNGVKGKMWMCLYNAVLQEMFTTRSEYLHLFQEFQKLHCSTRSMPKVVSDNGKTFKSANKIVQGMFYKPEVRKHFSELQVDWTFNMEKAPCGGGGVWRVDTHLNVWSSLRNAVWRSQS